MATAAQGSYTLLVANFSRPMPSLLVGADPEVAGPTKTRSGFVFGHLQNIGLSPQSVGGVITSTSNMQLDIFETTPPARPTGTLTVANNTMFAGSAILRVGQFNLVVGRDFAIGGAAAATATNIATAIGNLPGYDATPVAAEVTVEGPVGVAPATLGFSAYYLSTIANFTFVYIGVEGFLGYTDSPITIGILPASAPNHFPPP